MYDVEDRRDSYLWEKSTSALLHFPWLHRPSGTRHLLLSRRGPYPPFALTSEHLE